MELPRTSSTSPGNQETLAPDNGKMGPCSSSAASFESTTKAKEKKRKSASASGAPTSSSLQDEEEKGGDVVPSSSPSSPSGKRKAKKPPSILSAVDRRALATLGNKGNRDGKERSKSELASLFDVAKKTAGKCRNRFLKGESLRDKSRGPTPRWTVAKAVFAIVQIPAVAGQSLIQRAVAAGIERRTFFKLRGDVKMRLQSATVDLGFSGRGLEQVVEYIRGSNTTIWVGMFILTHTKVVEALLAAMQRGFAVKVMTDLDFARTKSFDSLVVLMKADIQLYHCTDTYHRKIAIFDQSVLLLGSQNWTPGGLRGPNIECVVVLCGPIVSAFHLGMERQFNLAAMDDSQYERELTKMRAQDPVAALPRTCTGREEGRTGDL